ncbi:p53 and DNA damage-regulated protein 1-like isoform X2, partial [Biomphalaria pfeifferi]
FDVIENEISKLRSTLKPKVNKLRDLEKKDDLKGFNLSPLTPSELKSVESLL